DKSGSYVVYNYSYCDAYNEGNHNVQGDNACVGTCSVCGLAVVSHSDSALVNVTVEYASFAKVGAKVTSCENKGCTYSVTEDLPALFICKGFSSSNTGNGISLGFEVNNKAIADYTSLTGKTVKYGVFAGSQKNLGTSDIFDADVSAKVITAEIKATEFTAFDIKVVGFENETQKSTLLALGAYVALTDGEETVYSYMQSEEPEENAKYSFTSYNNQINA
ncbi:MAG: hypothetical protein IJ039_06925, partial [Clostridia bacterium]|nr:hypothetical protein [Clostridia bacterium]